MTQQEFTERTGLRPSAQDFEDVHAIYMNTNMDKDKFCKEWKVCGGMDMIRDLQTTIKRERETAAEVLLKSQHTKDMCVEVADFLLEKAADYDYSEFRSMAVRILGKESEAVKATIRLGLPLGSADLEYIKNNLQ